METAGEVIIYYKDKLSLARQLLIITESIRTLVQNGQIEQMVAKVKKRQEIINQLKIIEQRLSPQRRSHKSLLDSMTGQGINNIRPLIITIRKIIEKIKALDMEIRAVVEHERQMVAENLNKVSIGHKLIKKYAPTRTGTPRYFRLSA